MNLLVGVLGPENDARPLRGFRESFWLYLEDHPI